MRTSRWVPRALGLALLALSCLRGAPARADDEALEPWLPGDGYAAAGQVVDGATVFHVWACADGEAAARGECVWCTLLRVQEDVVQEAYDLTRVPQEGAAALLSVRRRAAPDEPQGSRIAESPLAQEVEALAVAQQLVGQLLPVEARWHAATELLAQAEQAAQDPEDATARGLLREATRGLERARAQAPWHLGVLCDLLAAYQLLLPYEVGTDRGANISFLWRDACRAWLDGDPTEEESIQGWSCVLACALAEGCYPLAADVAQGPLLAGRQDVEPVLRALTLLGQAEREAGERLTLTGPRGTVDLQAIACPREPRSAGLPWHRVVYVTRAPGEDGPTLPVWFSLSLEGESGARRWALVGWVGGSRRVLRLYGEKEPARAEVDAYVVSLVQQTADAPEVR